MSPALPLDINIFSPEILRRAAAARKLVASGGGGGGDPDAPQPNGSTPGEESVITDPHTEPGSHNGGTPPAGQEPAEAPGTGNGPGGDGGGNGPVHHAPFTGLRPSGLGPV